MEDQGVESAIALGFATANQAAMGNVTEEALAVATLRLRKALDKQPTNRTVGIILGRLYRWSNQYQKAIDVLSEVIKARETAKMPPDTDLAALYYNRSCYHALMARRDDGHDHRAHAYADLRMAVQHDPTNEASATSDGDFALIKNDPAFRKCFDQAPQRTKPARKPRRSQG